MSAFIKNCFRSCPYTNLEEGEISNRTKVRFICKIVLLLLSAVLVITILIILLKRGEKIGCQINPFEVDPSPIVLIAGTNDFIYPKRWEKVLSFTQEQSLDFICPGQRIILEQSETKSSVLSGTCVTGSTFKIGNEEVQWKSIKCTDYPSRTIRYTENCCGTNGREIEAGFKVGNNRFLRSLLICFNQKLQIAYYTYVKLPASINERVRYTSRPSFQQGSGFYDIGNVDKLYLRKKQRVTINRLLGLPDNSTKYIQDTTNYFLSRGHMTASHDNFYGAQQNATFFFQNVAPQWHTFNGYNWNQIEIDVRDYAEGNDIELQVWTGVHGVTTLPHEVTKKPIELYLFVDTTANRTALPVPEIYWKVAYNSVTERGVAIIGINNPYNSTFATVCDDVSQKLTWLHCDRNNQQQGFCYACSIEDFRRVVTSLPDINDKGLLL